MKYLNECKQIIEISRRLHKMGCLAACDGNLSIRVAENIILITPSACPKAFITEKEIVHMDLDGNSTEGEPSSEKQMHLAVYRKAPKAKAVIHAHPPTATAWSIAYPDLTELPCDSCSELILALGKVPIVPYARPGTIDMGKNIEKCLPERRVMILSRHGSLTWGENIEEAYFGQERLEHSAKMLMYASRLNKLHSLPKEEVKALEEMRKKLGDKIL